MIDRIAYGQYAHTKGDQGSVFLHQLQEILGNVERNHNMMKSNLSVRREHVGYLYGSRSG